MIRRLPLVAIGLCAACIAARTSPPATSELARELTVEAGAILCRAEVGTISPDEFAIEVAALERARRPGAAERAVRRYPEVALLALVSHAPHAAGARVALAHAFDRAASSSASADTHADAGEGVWSAWIKVRTSNPEFEARYARERGEVLLAFEKGDAASAGRAAAALAHDSTSPIAAFERARLAGIAALLEPGESSARSAAREFERGAGAVAEQAFASSQIWLLACAAHTRGGDVEGARRAWTRAVASGLAAARADAFCDPAFFERAVDLRPEGAGFDAGAVETLAILAEAALGAPLDDPRVELPPDVAARIVAVAARLSREEANAALLGASRVDALATSADVSGLMRVLRARSLMALGQTDAARSAFTMLAADEHPRVARAALARLAALELAGDAPSRARRLLEKALALAPEIEWSDAAQAQANLGLACLSSGSVEEGLRALHSAQRKFEEERDVDELLVALENELAWQRAYGKAARVSELEVQLARESAR